MNRTLLIVRISTRHDAVEKSTVAAESPSLRS